MNVRSIPWLAVAAAASLASASAFPAEAPPAPAQPTLGDVLDSSAMSYEAGEWAEYARVENGKVNFADTFRLSFIAGADGKWPWTEIWMGKTGGLALRFRKVGQSTESYFKMGGAIYRIDDPQIAAKISCADGSCAPKPGDKPNPNKTIVGMEQVHTTAGSFQCTKVRVTSEKGDTVLWTTAEVPAMHMAKVNTPVGYGYELVAFGKNATSAFPAHFVANPLPLQHMKAVEALTPAMVPAQPSSKQDGGVPGPFAPDAGAPLPPLKNWEPRDAGRK